jgi:hypothetical protein
VAPGFVLGGYGGPKPEEQLYVLYKDARFNSILEWFDYKNTMEWADKVGGLVVFANLDRRLREEKDLKIEDFAAEFKSRGASCGYYLYDEPNILGTADIKYLASVGRRISSIAPDQITWVNFYYEGTGNKEAFKLADDLLDLYVPSVISVDYYPFSQSHDLLDEYCLALAWIRSLSLKHAVPFWSFVQAAGFGKNRVPTPAELRWQAYTSIAYGAKGLWYFSYPTILHSTAKDLNTEISNIAPVISRLKSTDVVHTGRITGGFKQFVPNTLVSAISSDMLIVGYFIDDMGIDFALFVNKDTTRFRNNNVLTCGSVVKGVSRINMESGKEETVGVSDMRVTFDLGPGDALLLKFNR